jgi:hypothetical protein
MAKKAKPAKGRPAKAKLARVKPAKGKPAKVKPVKAKAKPAKAAPPKAKAKPTAPRMDWFDLKTSKPLLDGYARSLKSFVDTMADGRVDASEVEAQETRIVNLMKEVEPSLSDKQHDKVTRLLCELTAYDIMRLLHALEEARPKSTFQG